MGITSTQLSLEQFLKQPETKPASEFIDGEILQKPMPKVGAVLRKFIEFDRIKANNKTA